MARYIDAEKIEWHEQLEPFGNGKYEYCRVAYMDDIDDIPSADVVEVVRCKDCRYNWLSKRKWDGVIAAYIQCEYFIALGNGEWYCSKGRRIDGMDH